MGIVQVFTAMFISDPQSSKQSRLQPAIATGAGLFLCFFSFTGFSWKLTTTG
jgi:hypothetical protein